MAGKRPTSSDVARLAGVSQPTVSMILNHYENARFSEETVKKVMDACEKLNYQIPCVRRQNGDSVKNKLLMTISPTWENLHYVRLLNAAVAQAEAKGYTLAAFASNRDSALEKQFVDTALAAGAAGVLFLYKPINRAALVRLTSQIPVVVVCDKTEIKNANIVVMDSEKTGILIGEHLLSLGHKKIAYISTELSERFVPRWLRLEGLKKAFQDAHVSPYNIRVCTPESEKMPDTIHAGAYETGFYLGGAVLDRYPEVTAFVGVNDMVAMGVMDVLLERKYKIPRDYSVCGCDNTIVSRYHAVSLTSVEHFSTHRGQEAINVLIRKIEDPDGINLASSVQVEYVPKLIARNSTGPNRRKN